MFECKICNFKSEHTNSINKHIILVHNLQPKEYYNIYLKKYKNEELCNYCKKELRFLSITKGFNQYCSIQCRNVDPVMIKRQNQTCIEKYGGKTPLFSKEIQNQIKINNIKKYGVESTNQLKSVKNKKKQTCLEKYGVENPAQVQEFKEKNKNTCLEKFGVEYYTQTDEYKEKSKQSNIDRYGVEHFTQSKEYQDRRKITCLEKYGKTHHMHNIDIFNKCMENIFKKKKYTLPSGNIVYKMGYEPQFLDYVFKNDVLKENEIDYYPDGIKYIGVDSDEHYYFPDFYIEKWNLIVECKSDWIKKLQGGTAIQEAKELACKNKNFNYLYIENNNFDLLDKYIKENII